MTTYDLEGNKIDSAGFYAKSSIGFGYRVIEYLTFNADRTITVLDTAQRWEINEDGTAKEVRLGSYPKPRGRVPLNKSGEPAKWCSKTRMWLGFGPSKG